MKREYLLIISFLGVLIGCEKFEELPSVPLVEVTEIVNQNNYFVKVTSVVVDEGVGITEVGYEVFIANEEQNLDADGFDSVTIFQPSALEFNRFTSTIGPLVPSALYSIRPYLIDNVGRRYVTGPSQIFELLGDTWYSKSDLNVSAMVDGMAFSLRGKGYIGLGLKSGGPFLEYDPQLDQWSRKNPIPISEDRRTSPKYFQIDDKAYFFGGSHYDSIGGALWKYDVDSDVWSQTDIKVLQERPHRSGALFTMGNRACIGLGLDGRSYSCLNPLDGSWSPIPEYPSSMEFPSIAFSFENKAIVGFGIDENGQRLNEFWEYNFAQNSWSRLGDSPRVSRFGSAYLNNDKVGYVLGDEVDNFWQYNPEGDKWTQLSDTPYNERQGSLNFIIGDRLYVAGGSDHVALPIFLNDFWEYIPHYFGLPDSLLTGN